MFVNENQSKMLYRIETLFTNQPCFRTLYTLNLCLKADSIEYGLDKKRGLYHKYDVALLLLIFKTNFYSLLGLETRRKNSFINFLIMAPISAMTSI